MFRRWTVRLTALLAVVAVAACTVEPGPPGGGDAGVTTAPAPRGFVVSYAGATAPLAGMDELEQAEQVRDWARYGLAAYLKLDTTALVATGYDTFPVRDEGFADLANQPVGDGRALFADGVLHLLVRKDDPHRERTISLLLDQQRTDAGEDPERVRLHEYTVDTATESIRVASADPVAVGDFRRDHGYVRQRVDTEQGLTDFLATVRALATVEVVGSEVWAGGWQWADQDGQRLTRADVAVLQRGYRAGNGPRPGFSLDPVTATTADLAALVPGLDGGVRAALAGGSWAGTAFGSAGALTQAVQSAVFGEPSGEPVAQGLPTDRAQLWALYNYLTRGPAFSKARYDAGLEGTEVGMTLFYTDYVAKHWANGVGDGVPADAVRGFVPDSKAETPWSHCAGGRPVAESGRLWFGRNEAAYSSSGDRISIGAQPTRLFAKSNGANGTEVETSYSFGRGLRWWDQHFQQVADYEPQYQRLDHIMRWSAALEWLSDQPATLPPDEGVELGGELRFADWYRTHSLREQAPVHFVKPPSAERAESVIAVPTAPYRQCGMIAVRGGVSLSDLGARKAMAGRTFEADLPGTVRRAGLYDEKSSFDQNTGTGSATRVSIDEKGAVTGLLGHTINRKDAGPARVDVTANARKVTSLGPFKVWRSAKAQRDANLALSGVDGQVSAQLRYQGQDFGGLTAIKQGDVVTLTWRSGLVDRMKNVLESVRNRVAHKRGAVPVTGMLYRMRTGGRDLYRVGGRDEQWLTLTGQAVAGEPLALRLGLPESRPGLVDPRPGYRFATLVPEPALPSGQWLNVAPATDGTAAIGAIAPAPAKNATSVTVHTDTGHTTKIYPDSNGVRVAADDPVFGLNGTAEAAAMMRGYPKVADAIRAATDARDGRLRGVQLGHGGADGVVLAGADGIRLVRATDPWAHQVARATRQGRPEPPLFTLTGGYLFRVADIPLRPVAGSGSERLLGEVLDEQGTVLVSESVRATMQAIDGPVVADALPRDLEVTVVEARIDDSATGATVSLDTAAQPEVWAYRDADWWRVLGRPDVVPGDSPTIVPLPPTTTTTPPSGDGGPVPVFLVCDRDDDEACAA